MRSNWMLRIKAAEPGDCGQAGQASYIKLVLAGSLAIFVYLSVFNPVPLMAAELTLTPAEQAWLDAHPGIRLGPSPRFPPFEFIDEKGNYQGVLAEFTKLMQEHLGIHFELVKRPAWNEVVDAASRGELDFLMQVARTTERERFLAFSKPYLLLPTLIYVRGAKDSSMSLEDFVGKQVVMVSKYASTFYVQKNYPQLELRLVPDLEQGLKLVSDGQADAIVVAQAPADFYMRKTGIENLNPVGESGYFYELALATRKDWPMLLKILNKAMDSISPAERRRIFRDWSAAPAN